MSQVEDREDGKDEQAILEAASKINLSKLLEEDYVDIEIPVIPGHLTVTYRSPFGEEVFDIEEELASLDSDSELAKYNYSIFRTLATSVVKLNDAPVPKAETVTDKIELLKRKPKHVIDRLLWGHVVMSEALKRLVEDPEKIEEQIKNSLGTP
jgi:hypothetical protein